MSDPAALVNELIRVTRPGGTIYLNNNTWWSPWGGFETSPWHLLSGAYGRRRYVKRNGHDPSNAFGVTFFKVRVKTVIALLKDDPRIVIVNAGPRWLPHSMGWLARVPIVRELATINLSVRVERIYG